MTYKEKYRLLQSFSPASTTVWIIPWIIVIIPSITIADPCPDNCACTVQFNGTHVDCRARDLRHIPRNIPTDTITLNLGYNTISEIATNSLPVLYNVKELKLDNNEITTLFNNAFDKFPNLQELTLDSNKIVDIHKHAFSGLSDLKYLDLQSNSIAELQPGVFRNLHLDRLNLNNNLLQNVDKSHFHNAKISELHLDQNNIATLEKEDLIYLTDSLTKLYLSYNQQSITIEANAFEDFNLTHTSLRYDGLTDAGFIENLVTRKLDLSGNQLHISSIQNYPSLSNVEELYLVNCSIDGLDADYFLYMDSLKALDISSNHLRVLPEDVFKYAQQVETLVINENKLSDFTCSVPNLNILMLSSNQISTVTSLLSNFQLLELDLSYNRIQVIDETLRGEMDAIPTLNLHGNPFHCNCELRWFREWLETRESYTGAYKCHSPTPGYIMDRTPEEFVCKEPVIKFISPDVAVAEGGEVLISCTGEGDPAPVVEFVTPIEGQEYSVSPPKNRTNMRTFAAYKLTRIDSKGGGAYTCEATSIAGKASASMHVTVLSDKTPPTPHVVTINTHSMTSPQDSDVDLSTVSQAPLLEGTTAKMKTKNSNMVIILVVCVSLLVALLLLIMIFVVKYAKNHRHSKRYNMYKKYKKQKSDSDRVDYYKMNGKPPDDGTENGIAMV